MSQIKPSGIVRQKQPRQKDENYLKAIRQCDCLVCSTSAPSEAAHVRYGDMKYGKYHTGMQEKSSDMWVTPLCSGCHIKQHKMNERQFWKDRKIDPLDVARKLYACNNDVPSMQAIVNKISVFARMG